MIYSIGYQGLKVPHFLSVLDHFDIGLVIDCRARPQSRNRAFCKAPLELAITKGGLSRRKYESAGKMLGGFGGVTPAGLDYVRAIAKGKTNAVLLCMEHAPGECHRHHDIALKLGNVEVTHIFDNELVTASELQRSFDEDDGYEYEEFELE